MGFLNWQPELWTSLTRRSVIIMARITWCGLAGMAIFLAVVIFLHAQGIAPVLGRDPEAGQVMTILSLAAFGLAATVLPVMWLIRRWHFRRNRDADGSIPPSDFLSGNLVLWAGCDSVGMFSIVLLLLGGVGPVLILLTVAAAAMLFTSPFGSRVKFVGQD
jgi:cation transporter-like permease